MRIFKIDLPFVFFIIAVILSLSILFVFDNDMVVVIRVLAFSTLLYLVVAFLHHKKEKTLSWDIVIEYVVLFLLGLVLVSDVLNIT